MHKSTDHNKGNKAQAAADRLSAERGNDLVNSELARMANDNPRVNQLRAYQQMANNSPQAQKSAGLQAMANISGMKKKNAPGKVYNAFAAAAGITLDTLTAMYADAELLGYTAKPIASVPPRYNYNAVQGPGGWTATPTQANAPNKGNIDDVVYVNAGTYETALVDEASGKKIKMRVSAAVSVLARQAEEEHVADFDYAYGISLQHIHTVLTTHIYNHAFGPAASKEAAEALVNAAILANINHADKFGTDPVDWDLAYQALCGQTKKRDDDGWHTFSQVVSAAAADQEDEWVTIDVTTGDAQIGNHASADVITCDELEDLDEEEDALSDEEQEEAGPDNNDEESGSDSDDNSGSGSKKAIEEVD